MKERLDELVIAIDELEDAAEYWGLNYEAMDDNTRDANLRLVSDKRLVVEQIINDLYDIAVRYDGLDK